MKKLLFLPLALLMLFSCKDDDDPSPREIRYQIYQEFLDGLEFDCPSDSTSAYYFKGAINGEQACYYDGIDGVEVSFGFLSKFETSGSSTSDSVFNVRQGANLLFVPFPLENGEEFIDLIFPCFERGKSRIEYIEALFAIENHQILSDQLEDNGFEVMLNLMELRGKNEGVTYPLSTRWGPQPNSYLRLRKAERSRIDDTIYYEIEMELACDLYHWEQNGQTGLWGRIEQASIRAKFPIK
ncbi:MAG: hypothetical protein AAFV95_24695 [Bacteroidota bacterium]